MVIFFHDQNMFSSISASGEDVPSISQPDPGHPGHNSRNTRCNGRHGKGRRPSGIILQAPGQEMMPLPRRVFLRKSRGPRSWRCWGVHDMVISYKNGDCGMVYDG